LRGPDTTIGIGYYQFIKRVWRRPAAPILIDRKAKFVYVAARNLVFGLILLTRCRLWAALPSELAKLWVLPPVR
jgi:hypothetical protein